MADEHRSPRDRAVEQIGVIVDVLLHRITAPRLIGTAVAATIVRDDPKSLRREKQHLPVHASPDSGTVQEDDRLTFAPILVQDSRAVFGNGVDIVCSWRLNSQSLSQKGIGSAASSSAICNSMAIAMIKRSVSAVAIDASRIAAPVALQARPEPKPDRCGGAGVDEKIAVATLLSAMARRFHFVNDDCVSR